MDFEQEWVDLPDDSYCVCDRCKKEVKRVWHKHIEYKVIGIPKYIVPPSLTDIYLCEHCYNEIMELSNDK